MALVNQQTGQTVSDMKNPTDMNAVIAKQSIEIYSLTSTNRDLTAKMSKLIEENVNLKAENSEISEMREIIRSLNEQLDTAHTEATNVKENLEKEKHTYKIRYEYSDKCFRCHKDEYDGKYEDARNKLDIAEHKLAEADRILKDRENSIMAYVNKKVQARTRAERLKKWLEAFGKGVNVLLIIFPLVYAAAVSVIALIRNAVFKNDVVTAARSIGKFFVWAFIEIKNLICSAANITENISNIIVCKILRWVIIILLAAVVIAALGGIGFGIYKLIKYLKKEHSEKFGLPFLGLILADIGVILFLGDIIRDFIEINLCLVFLIIIAVYFFFAYGLPVIIPAIIEGIENLVRGL